MPTKTPVVVEVVLAAQEVTQGLETAVRAVTV
jgi:hypothetical protein